MYCKGCRIKGASIPFQAALQKQDSVGILHEVQHISCSTRKNSPPDNQKAVVRLLQLAYQHLKKTLSVPHTDLFQSEQTGFSYRK